MPERGLIRKRVLSRARGSVYHFLPEGGEGDHLMERGLLLWQEIIFCMISVKTLQTASVFTYICCQMLI